METRENGFSISDKLEIARLYRELLLKDIPDSGCSDCYRDALIEICVFLKTGGNPGIKPSYGLKNGVVISDNRTRKIHTNSNLTDKVAERFLRKNPDSIGLFSRYPEDWKNRINLL